MRRPVRRPDPTGANPSPSLPAQSFSTCIATPGTPSLAASSAKGNGQAASFRPVGVPSLDSVFDKAAAIDQTIHNAARDLAAARDKVLNAAGAANLDGVRESLAGLGASAFRVDMANGVPTITVGSAVPAEASGLVGAVAELGQTVGRLSRELATLPAEVKALVVAVQEAAAKAPAEVKSLTQSGSIKPTEVPKLLKTVKGNVAATTALPEGVETLLGELKSTVAFLGSLASG